MFMLKKIYKDQRFYLKMLIQKFNNNSFMLKVNGQSIWDSYYGLRRPSGRREKAEIMI